MPHTLSLPGRRAWLALCMAAFAGLAQAHGGSAGPVTIGHPFATPTPAGATTGAAYLANLETAGPEPDRLVRASTPRAERVELHQMTLDAAGVMRMREVAAVPVVPGTPVRMRPGGGYHLMLVGLRQPLVEGETFPMTLVFERAGTTEVKIVVQVPRNKPATQAEHHH